MCIAPALRMLLRRGEGGSFVATSVQPETELFQESCPASRKREGWAAAPAALQIPWAENLDEQYAHLRQKMALYRQANDGLPHVVCLERVGIFAWGATKSQADAVLAAYSKASGDDISGGVELSAPEATSGRVAGRIVIITGGAQGFGQGIGEALVHEGASVVFADLNEAQVRDNLVSLAESLPTDQLMALKADVKDEEDVRRMLEETVLAFGGLDIIISNAGILRAGGLDEMDVATFEAVNRVNYTAFFLCAKYASHPMKVQHAFDETWFGDIIQINSKSGLAGSNKNFAYAGSKFGGIGLTQSFALELAPYNIKVNAICPGNLFDGPLWSDPEKGLFRQYLDAGKVPGASTVDDVRRFYEKKAPLGRGCKIEDVARAVLYVIEQTYETGQAVPVTGGQIMLK